MRFSILVGILKARSINSMKKVLSDERSKNKLDMQSLRILMDINALQSFGTVQSFSNNNQANSSLFSTMLGDVFTQSNAHLNNPTTGNPLLYHGQNDVFLPSSLALFQQRTENVRLNSPVENKQQPNNYSQLIKKAAEQFQVPERLISSIIQHESNFNNHSVSRAGAQGLMQLMPGTAKFLGVTDSFDPEQNITGGARYIKQMLNQFDGDIKLALAAYNAGPGNVKKYGGIPPFKETQNYVRKVLNTFQG